MAQEEGTHYYFNISLNSINWNARSIEAYVALDFFQSPYNTSYDSIVPIVMDQYGGANIPLFSYANPETPPYNLGGNVTTSFELVGPTQLYPFDSYVLNITFVLPFPVQEGNVSASSIINQTNTWFMVTCRIGEFDMTLDPPATANVGNMPPSGRARPNIVYQLYGPGPWGYVSEVEWVTLNCRATLFRTASSTNLITTVLLICYFLVGSLPLIRPDRLDYRLSVCLSLFVFSVTLTYTIQAPSLARETLAGTLIIDLLSAAGLFAIVSIILKTLIEVRQRLAICQYFVQGLVILTLTLSLSQQSWWFGWFTIKNEPWASIPPSLFPLLMVGVSYGYVAVTLAAIFNLLRRNRGRIRKHLGAKRIFGRHASKDTSP